MSLDSSIHCHFITPYISTDPNATVYMVATAAVTDGRCTEQRKTGEGGRVEWAGPGRAEEDKDARGRGCLFT